MSFRIRSEKILQKSLEKWSLKFFFCWKNTIFWVKKVSVIKFCWIFFYLNFFKAKFAQKKFLFGVKKHLTKNIVLLEVYFFENSKKNIISFKFDILLIYIDLETKNFPKSKVTGFYNLLTQKSWYYLKKKGYLLPGNTIFRFLRDFSCFREFFWLRNIKIVGVSVHIQ